MFVTREKRSAVILIQGKVLDGHLQAHLIERLRHRPPLESYNPLVRKPVTDHERTGMNAPERLLRQIVAPGVVLVRRASAVNTFARRRAAARWLRRMQVTKPKSSKTIRSLLTDLRR